MMVTFRLLLMGVLLACILIAVGAGTVLGGIIFSTDISSLTAMMSGRPTSTPAVAARAAGPSSPHVGDLTPDFTLVTVDDQSVTLSGLRGKAVMVNFWATWCGPCSAEMPNIEKSYQDLQGKDVVFLAVNQGEHDDQVKGYADIYRLHFPLLLDGDERIGALYRVQALPTTAFIGRDGILKELHVGGPMSVEFIETHMRTLADQQQ